MVGYISLSILVLVTLVSELTAFPNDFGEYADTIRHYLNRQKRQTLGAKAGFDAFTQRVYNTGDNEFVPPGDDDERGPCPALNVIANHNYLPHNGVATITQFIHACNTVFGMGIDLASVLALLGALVAGNGLSWSIGGPSKAVPNTFNHAYGISFSHNVYENDASFSRGDLFLFKNDAYSLQLPLFRAFLAKKNGTDPVYDPSEFIDYSAKRLADSKSENKYFVHGIISGLFAKTGAYHFLYRMFANHSIDFPDGILNQAVLKSYFAVFGSGNDLTYQRGHERIPDNWYKRRLGNDHGQLLFFADLARGGSQYIDLIIPGCNTDGVNSFNALSLEDLTGRVFSLTTLLQGNNLICFFLRVVEAVAAQSLPIVAGATRAISDVLLSDYGSLTGATSSIICPEIRYNASAFSICPGITRLNQSCTYSDAQ